MSAGDLAAVLVGVSVLVACVVLVVTVVSLRGIARELRETLEAVRRDTMPMVAELRGTVAEAGAEVQRVDDLLGAAEAISTRVDSASRLGYLAFKAPLIRFVALWRGIGRFLRRLLGGPSRSERQTAVRRTGRNRSARSAA